MKFAFCGRNGVGKSFFADALTFSEKQEYKIFNLEIILKLLKIQDRKTELLTLFGSQPFTQESIRILMPNVVEFSLYVKILAATLTGLSMDHFDGSDRELREKKKESIGKSPRKLLEEIGTWGRSIHPDFWVKAALRKSNNAHIADLRYENEAIEAKKQGYLIICIYSKAFKARKLRSDKNLHDSVWAFTQFPHLYDGMINNAREYTAFNIKILKCIMNPKLQYESLSEYAWTNCKIAALTLPSLYLGEPISHVRMYFYLDEVEYRFSLLPENLKRKILKKVERIKIFRNLFLILDEKKYACAELCFVIDSGSRGFDTYLDSILKYER